MPIKSKAQRRWLYWAESKGKMPKGTAAEWEAHTHKDKLPERVGKAAGCELLTANCVGLGANCKAGQDGIVTTPPSPQLASRTMHNRPLTEADALAAGFLAGCDGMTQHQLKEAIARASEVHPDIAAALEKAAAGWGRLGGLADDAARLFGRIRPKKPPVSLVTHMPPGGAYLPPGIVPTPHGSPAISPPLTGMRVPAAPVQTSGLSPHVPPASPLPPGKVQTQPFVAPPGHHNWTPLNNVTVPRGGKRIPVPLSVEEQAAAAAAPKPTAKINPTPPPVTPPAGPPPAGSTPSLGSPQGWLYPPDTLPPRPAPAATGAPPVGTAPAGRSNLLSRIKNVGSAVTMPVTSAQRAMGATPEQLMSRWGTGGGGWAQAGKWLGAQSVNAPFTLGRLISHEGPLKAMLEMGQALRAMPTTGLQGMPKMLFAGSRVPLYLAGAAGLSALADVGAGRPLDQASISRNLTEATEAGNLQRLPFHAAGAPAQAANWLGLLPKSVNPSPTSFTRDIMQVPEAARGLFSPDMAANLKLIGRSARDAFLPAAQNKIVTNLNSPSPEGLQLSPLDPANPTPLEEARSKNWQMYNRELAESPWRGNPAATLDQAMGQEAVANMPSFTPQSWQKDVAKSVGSKRMDALYALRGSAQELQSPAVQEAAAVFRNSMEASPDVKAAFGKLNPKLQQQISTALNSAPQVAAANAGVKPEELGKALAKPDPKDPLHATGANKIKEETGWSMDKAWEAWEGMSMGQKTMIIAGAGLALAGVIGMFTGGDEGMGVLAPLLGLGGAAMAAYGLMGDWGSGSGGEPPSAATTGVTPLPAGRGGPQAANAALPPIGEQSWPWESSPAAGSPNSAGVAPDPAAVQTPGQMPLPAGAPPKLGQVASGLQQARQAAAAARASGKQVEDPWLSLKNALASNTKNKGFWPPINVIANEVNKSIQKGGGSLRITADELRQIQHNPEWQNWLEAQTMPGSDMNKPAWLVEVVAAANKGEIHNGKHLLQSRAVRTRAH